MIYRIIRIDGEKDDVTSQTFSNYEEAYDLLDKIYGDICCSDADYEDIYYYDIVEGQRQLKKLMKKDVMNWEPTNEQNIGIISSVYEFIKEELSELQEVTGCPDNFIYDFIGRIQHEWHPESCHSLARNQKKILNNQ